MPLAPPTHRILHRRQHHLGKQYFHTFRVSNFDGVGPQRTFVRKDFALGTPIVVKRGKVASKLHLSLDQQPAAIKPLNAILGTQGPVLGTTPFVSPPQPGAGVFTPFNPSAPSRVGRSTRDWLSTPSQSAPTSIPESGFGSWTRGTGIGGKPARKRKHGGLFS